MRIIFFGTPDYVVPILKLLDKYHEVVAVVTQTPKEVGRRKSLSYSPVDKYAHRKLIPIYYSFDDLPVADLGICASYGKIIPNSVINNFVYGILNIHPSLLPKFRGASPVQQNMIEDPKNIGVTIIKLTEKLDAGPIVSSFRDELLLDDTGESLRNRLFEKSAQFVADLIPSYTKGKIKLKPQDEESATYTKILTRKDGFVDLDKENPEIIYRKLKAYTPWPGIWTLVQIISNDQKLIAKKRLKILEVDFNSVTCHLLPVTVQLEGKKPVSFKQFKEAYPSLSL